MDLKNLTVVGHSLGGGVALVLALEKEDGKRRRIKKLVLIDSVAYAQKIPLAFNLLGAPVIGAVANFLIPKELQALAALRIAYHDNSKFDSNDVAEYAAPLHEKGSQHAMIYSARQIMPDNINSLSERYSTIDIPTLILWCDHDKVIRPHVGWRLHQDLPNSTFRLVRGCGHIPQEERPEETAQAVLQFLAQ
jgi:pimeloyl-ACP methyl ester carboxylesterase